MIRSTIAFICLASPALADRIQADAHCAATATPLHYQCDVMLTSAGQPLEAAKFAVTPTMPSMPMAHNIPPAPSAPGDMPGSYKVDLRLDMLGEWMLTLDVSEPRRDRVIVHMHFDGGDTAHQGHDHSSHKKSE